MTALLTRIRKLEERSGPAGDCPVCRGEPPWGVQYDAQPPTGEPCPECGERRVIEVSYVRTGASAADRAQEEGHSVERG